MPFRTLFLLSVFVLSVSASPGAEEKKAEPDFSIPKPASVARPKDSWAPTLTTRPTQLTVLVGRGGRLTLSIEYPWRPLEDALIEVGLTPKEQGDDALAVPLGFGRDYYRWSLKGQIYRCLDRAGEGTVTESFEKNDWAFQILGQRNSLDRPAVHLVASKKPDRPEKRPLAVFVHLDSWAVDDGHLSLDLPRDVFAKPGKLFVWFYRKDKMLWEKTTSWPGYEKK